MSYQTRILRNVLTSAAGRNPSAPGLATLRQNIDSPIFRGLSGKRLATALLENAKNGRMRAPRSVFASSQERLTEFARRLSPLEDYQNEQFRQEDLLSRRTHRTSGALIGAVGGAVGGAFLGRKIGRSQGLRSATDRLAAAEAAAGLKVRPNIRAAVEESIAGEAGHTGAWLGGGLGSGLGARAGHAVGVRVNKDRPDKQDPAIAAMVRSGWPNRKFSSNMNTTAKLIALNARLDREVAFARRPQDEESHIGRNLGIAAGVGGLAYGGTALGRGLMALRRGYAKNSFSNAGSIQGAAGMLRKDPKAVGDVFMHGARQNNQDLANAGRWVADQFKRKPKPYANTGRLLGAGSGAIDV